MCNFFQLSNFSKATKVECGWAICFGSFVLHHKKVEIGLPFSCTLFPALASPTVKLVAAPTLRRLLYVSHLILTTTYDLCVGEGYQVYSWNHACVMKCFLHWLHFMSAPTIVLGRGTAQQSLLLPTELM